jgi:hypothetical protein
MKTLCTWTACAVFILAWGAASAYFDQEREQIEARDAAMAANATKNAAAYALCKSENATPVWTTSTNVDCLTTKGRVASKQVVAVNP